MIKTVTTTTGVNTVTFPEFFKYFWIKNIGDTTVYASAFANVSAGVDNTSVIKSGDTVCVENIDNDNVYISGEGSVEIHAQNYADCPFKVGGKGGEIPDLSVYAKTADVPNIKVNAAVNADTVGGHSVNADVPENAVFTDTIPDLSAYAKKTDVPSIKVNSAVNADTAGLIKSALIGTDESCAYHTILDWANSVDGMGQADIVVAGGFPSDIPVGDEGMLTVETDFENNRKVVTFKSYGSGRGTYRRNIWSGEWRWDWVDLFSEKPYVTGTLSEQASDSPVTLSFTIFDFTPSKIICQFGDGSAFFANVVTNGFSLTIPAGTTTIHYIAFK